MLVTLAPLASPLGNFHLIRGRLTASVSILLAAFFVISSAAALPPTTTLLSSSSTAVSSGAAITLTATVSTSSGLLYNGQVAFCDATAPHCTDIHRLFVAPLIAGNATYKFIPGPGTHTYNAVFLGINPYAGSTSSTVSVTVTPRHPTATSIAQGGSAGSYSEFSAISGPGTTPPTGIVSFLDTSNNNYVLGSAALTPGTPSLTFTNSHALSPGSFPNGVVSGDFYGDGETDLAVVNYGSNSVTILLGNGNGTFSIHATLTGFTNPSAIVAADFNNDGILDLAVINNGTNEVWVMLGTGLGNFGSPMTTSVSVNPSALAVADFNDDGTPDLVVTSTGSNSVDVLTNNGYGSFSLTGLHAVGNTPTSVAVADFNNDGKQDMVVTNYNDGTVTVLFGNGNGNIASSPTPSTFGAFGGSYSVVTADFNGDGNQDFAVANYLNNSVEIFLGNGSGGFTHSSVGTGSYPIALAVADFNGDGIPDLVAVDASSPSGSVSVLPGNGDGTFAGYLSAPVGNDPRSVSVGDFNQDGVTDLVVPNYLDATATVLLAQPTQSATTTAAVASPVGTGTHSVVASYPGDVNFAASTSGTSGLAAQPVATTLVLSAHPASSVSGQPVTLVVTLSPTTAQSHSTDNETIYFISNGGSVLLGTAALTGGAATLNVSTLPTGLSTVMATYSGDVNFNSAASNTISYTVASVTSTTLGTGHTSAPAGFPITLTATVLSGSTPITPGLVAFCDATAPYCTDIHRFGTAQLTSAGTATLQVTPKIGSNSYKAIFLGTTAAASSSSAASAVSGTGRFPTATALTSSGAPGNDTLAASVTSISRTALSGVVSFVDTTNGNAALGSASLGASVSSFSLSAPYTFSTSTSPRAIATGDFNNDGLADFVTAAYAGNALTIELGNGDGTFTFAPNPSSTTLSNPNAIAVGDFNSDGNQDIAVVNYGNGSVSIFFGHGDGTFTALPAVYGTGLLPQAFVAADFNNDGILDLAIASAYNNTVSIFLGHGDGTFAAVSAHALSAGNYPAAIVAADFNNDGNQDIAVANVVDSTITLFFGDGTGQFRSGVTIPSLGGSYGLATADLNADGNADLIALNSGGNTVTVLLGNGTGAFTVQASPVTATNPIAVAVGDLNADGIPDLVTGNSNAGNTLDLFLGNGDGTFQPAIPYATGSVPQALALADFNNDGFADPITANSTGNTAILLLAQPTLTATAAINNISPTGAIGPHAVQANFAGDPTHAPSASNFVSLSPLSLAVSPIFSPAAGTYASAQSVTLATSTPNATIFYTTDGSTPTTASPIYTTPLSVAASETIKALSTAANYQPSSVATATYTINYPPTITTQPTSQAITSGNTVTLSVTATSATPLIYQWFSGASPNTANPISGATSSTYTTPVLTATGTQTTTFNYWVQVSNASANPTNSNTATVTVNPRPVAATPTFSPPAGTYTSTQTVTITSNIPTPNGGIYYTTDGSTPTTASPQYTAPLSLTASETIRAFAAASGYQNSPVATATYTINNPPTITNPPSSLTINSGGSATLSVSASGTAPLTYQWFSGPAASSLTSIVGATAASYTASALTATTYFQVQVNNASSIPATSTVATVTVITKPLITGIAVQPVSQTVNTGSSATLSVTATGTSPSFQWYSGVSGNTATSIVGATGSNYTTPPLTATSSFWVRASNQAGNADSGTATITVIQTPVCTLSVQPTSTALTVVATSRCVDPQNQVLTSQTITWGDGSSSAVNLATGTNTHSYAALGAYTVTLSATDTSGLTGTATARVSPNQSPVCTLGVVQGQISAILTQYPVTVTGNCLDPQSQSLTLTLNWGDGTVVTLAAPPYTHTYSSASTVTYNIVLTATDASGLTGSSAPQPVQIVSAQAIPAGGSTPIASTIPPPPTPLAAPVQVTFLCSSVSVEANGQVVTTLPSAYGISCTSPSIPLTSSPTPVNVTISTSNGAVAANRHPDSNSTLALCGLACPFLGLAFILPLTPARRRRITALALACILCLSLSACGGYFQSPAAPATPTGLYYITLVETIVPPQVAPTGFVQTSLIVPLPVTH